MKFGTSYTYLVTDCDNTDEKLRKWNCNLKAQMIRRQNKLHAYGRHH